MPATACTDGPSERTVATTLPAATTTFETLPPVGIFTYPTDPGAIVVQISIDGPIAMPLFTVYGDGRVITVDEDRWVEGRVTDLVLQGFLDEARSVGLLDKSLVLREPFAEGQPNITVTVDVDGRRLEHEFDLVRIERPVALRAFLQRAATSNVFELTAEYDPGVWFNCAAGECAQADAPAGDFSRPLLPAEDRGALAASAGIADP